MGNNTSQSIGWHEGYDFANEMCEIEKIASYVEGSMNGIDHATGLVADHPPTDSNYTTIGVWSNPDIVVYIVHINDDELYAWHEVGKN